VRLIREALICIQMTGLPHAAARRAKKNQGCLCERAEPDVA